MGISVQSRKFLWGKSAMRCAFPDCDAPLSLSKAGVHRTVVGIECHIIAQKDHASVARSPSSLTDEERIEYAHLIEDRDSYDNLALMCGTHSFLIDDPAQGYSVRDILEMKRNHELSVEGAGKTPGPDQDEARYAEIVDGWAARIDLDRWPELIAGVFMDGHPRIEVEDFDRMGEAADWIFNRVWPGSIREIERSMDNFRRVVVDFSRVMTAYPHEHLKARGLVAPNRFYNDLHWSERYGNKRAGELYQYLSYLMEDYALELTRAANLVCEAVRQTLDPRFRFDEGLLTMESGPYMDDQTHLFTRRHRPTYKDPLEEWMPYEGLAEFPTARSSRDELRDDRPVPEELPGIIV